MALARIQPTLDIYQRIRQEVDGAPNSPPSLIASNILRMVSKEDLHPLLVEAVQGIQRIRVRGRERIAFGALMTVGASAPASGRTPVPAMARIEALRKLHNETFRIGDGTEVMWGQATIAEHRARLNMLRNQQTGLTQTITQHETAVALLRKHKALCLDDIL